MKLCSNRTKYLSNIGHSRLHPMITAMSQANRLRWTSAQRLPHSRSLPFNVQLTAKSPADRQKGPQSPIISWLTSEIGDSATSIYTSYIRYTYINRGQAPNTSYIWNNQSKPIAAVNMPKKQYTSP